jgi:hypothetical protein
MIICYFAAKLLLKKIHSDLSEVFKILCMHMSKPSTRKDNREFSVNTIKNKGNTRLTSSSNFDEVNDKYRLKSQRTSYIEELEEKLNLKEYVLLLNSMNPEEDLEVKKAFN